MAYRVVLVDDHQMLRDAIHAILQRSADFEVVGQADNGADAVRVCLQTAPNLVLMDIGLPGMNGIEVTTELSRHNPAIRILILSMYDDQDSVLAAVRAGARGFVLKKSCATDLLAAMTTVASGGTYFDAKVSDQLLSGVMSGKVNAPARSHKEALSPREHQVLRLTVDGKSNKEVAVLLNLEVHTVRSYRKSMMAKLGATNVAELIQVSVASGLMERIKPGTAS